MGVSFTATAIIGVRIPRAKLFRKETVRTFPHDHPPEVKFHPQTGRALWRVDDVPIDGYDEDREKLLGEPVIAGAGDGCGYTAYYFVGVSVAVGGGSGGEARLPLPDAVNLGVYLNGLRAKLGLLDLWNDAEVGLWAVADVSC